MKVKSDHRGDSVAGLEIRRSRVQVSLWPLARLVRGSPWFNSSVVLIHNQVVCRLPVGIFNLLSSFQLFVSLALKSPSNEWSIKYVCIAINSPIQAIGRKKPENFQGKFIAMITLHLYLQPQYNMNFVYISHHFTAREYMKSTNWPRLKCVAPQLSYPVSWKSRVRIPLKPWYFFRLLPSNCLNWKIYCDDHFSLSNITNKTNLGDNYLSDDTWNLSYI